MDKEDRAVELQEDPRSTLASRALSENMCLETNFYGQGGSRGGAAGRSDKPSIKTSFVRKYVLGN